VIHNNVIYVANAGDSRGIIAQKGGKAKGMSVDHKPDREDEEKRIKALGTDIYTCINFFFIYSLTCSCIIQVVEYYIGVDGELKVYLLYHEQ